LARHRHRIRGSWEAGSAVVIVRLRELSSGMEPFLAQSGGPRRWTIVRNRSGPALGGEYAYCDAGLSRATRNLRMSVRHLCSLCPTSGFFAGVRLVALARPPPRPLWRRIWGFMGRCCHGGLGKYVRVLCAPIAGARPYLLNRCSYRARGCQRCTRCIFYPRCFVPCPPHLLREAYGPRIAICSHRAEMCSRIRSRKCLYCRGRKAGPKKKTGSADRFQPRSLRWRH